MESEKSRLNKFIINMEVVYAVLLAWGYARGAECFVWNPDYVLALIISGLVLIRFFFAASHNLQPMAEQSGNSFFSLRFLFLWDIALLVIHSFIYYRMCYALSKQEYFKFYIEFSSLLTVNLIWLGSIYHRSMKNKLFWVQSWGQNNFGHLFVMGVVMYAALHSDKKADLMPVLFLVALSNCLLDFFLTAPSYLGIKDKSPGKKKKVQYFLLFYALPMLCIYPCVQAVVKFINYIAAFFK